MSRTVLFVDADFNGFTNQGIYEPFCRWFHRKYGRDTLVIDTTPGEGEPWEIAQEIWRDHHVFTGGYKTFGGAGQVVWIDRGVVIDNAFIMDFVHLSELQSRTEKVFE